MVRFKELFIFDIKLFICSTSIFTLYIYIYTIYKTWRNNNENLRYYQTVVIARINQFSKYGWLKLHITDNKVTIKATRRQYIHVTD